MIQDDTKFYRMIQVNKNTQLHKEKFYYIFYFRCRKIK